MDVFCVPYAPVHPTPPFACLDPGQVPSGICLCADPQMRNWEETRGEGGRGREGLSVRAVMGGCVMCQAAEETGMPGIGCATIYATPLLNKVTLTPIFHTNWVVALGAFSSHRGECL